MNSFTRPHTNKSHEKESVEGKQEETHQSHIEIISEETPQNDQP
jgi:hypothetical protein